MSFLCKPGKNDQVLSCGRPGGGGVACVAGVKRGRGRGRGNLGARERAWSGALRRLGRGRGEL